MSSDTPPPAGEGGLTRALLLSGDLPAMIAAAHPEVQVLSDAERLASLEAMLASRPEHGDGLWVFAYGSLIWNPLLHYTARRMARVLGWRRSFCLSTKAGRGTPENPGLMLGLALDPPGGPGCTGVVFRIAEEALAVELDILWRREMVASGYIPRWVALEDETGAPMGAAIAFTINPAGPSYCGDLPEGEVVERLATASGGLGTAAEYLFRTHQGLAEMGIIDPFVEGLAQKVDARLKHIA
jgi:cation transport protein ChaC